MGGGRHWFSAVRRTFARSSCKTIAVVNIDDDSNSTTTHNARLVEEAAAVVEADAEPRVDEQALTREDLAAIEIQAHFRGHLARRAYRALRSLVRVQAVVRGVCVRRQARLAIHCMQAMVRLQVKVRARQLLSSSGCAEL